MVHQLLSRRSLKILLLRQLHGGRTWFQYSIAHRRPRRIVFILCPWPRTGSNLLRTYLSSFPGGELRGEVLSRDEIQGIRWSYITRQAALRHLRVSVMTSGPQLGGCKLIVLIAYEDLCRDPNAIVRSRICPLLGLPPTPVSTNLVKQDARPLQQVIENYSDVESFLQSAKRDESDRLTPAFMAEQFAGSSLESKVQRI